MKLLGGSRLTPTVVNWLLGVSAFCLFWTVIYLPKLQTSTLLKSVDDYRSALPRPDPMILGTLDKGLIDSENAVRTGSIQGAAGLVRMGHEGRSAGHRHQGGAGSRTRTAGLARSLRPARTMERPGRRLSIRGWGQTPPEAPLPMPTGSKLNRWPFQATC